MKRKKKKRILQAKPQKCPLTPRGDQAQGQAVGTGTKGAFSSAGRRPGPLPFSEPSSPPGFSSLLRVWRNT